VRERTQQLEQANRELEAFSYSISHDLRAPVRAINGFTQIIRNDHSAHLSSEVARLFQVIGSNAERMGQLIDDLLAFSHLSVRELSRQTVNMTALAQSVVAELGYGMARESARFRLHKLPLASGDSSMLRQVLTNLIGNALKFSREAAQPCIEIGAWREERRLVYFVRDNGIGFNMKHACKLFKVFQRLHGSGKFEGTGVGLAIVQRIVQRHGGEVWAESLPGAGATFFFSLPGQSVLLHEPAQSPAPPSEGVCF
jgi:light-regulated signal transduction histidine kinase (bacteriophytochrome)